MIQLDEKLIENLSYKGVLAYVAASYAGSGVYTTYLLATSVQCTTGLMRDGMGELAIQHPTVVQWLKTERKWQIAGAASTGQILQEESIRRINLLDDIRAYWNHLNPDRPFLFSGPDGAAVGQFLKRHREWSRRDWQMALNNRAKSVINKSEPIYKWLSKLEEYASGPLDQYMKPMTNGGGRVGKAIDLEVSNRAAREAAVSGATNRA
jgi:hypothetical protein